MDTTRVEFMGKQLDKVVDLATQHPTGLSTGEVALIAATIGALSAILAQLLVFTLTRRKDREVIKKALLADERRFAVLLTEYYKELVMHKVHKQYWYRTSEIRKTSEEDGKDSHERHFKSNDRSFATLTRIRETTSEYFKAVTHFASYTEQNEIIDKTLEDIKLFKPRKASDFSEVQTYNELLIAQEVEEEELNKVYLFYSDSFDRINTEMKEILKLNRKKTTNA